LLYIVPEVSGVLYGLLQDLCQKTVSEKKTEIDQVKSKFSCLEDRLNLTNS